MGGSVTGSTVRATGAALKSGTALKINQADFV